MNPVLIAVLGGAAAALLCTGVFWWWLAASVERQEVSRRLEEMTGDKAPIATTEVMRDEAQSEIPLLNRLLGYLQFTSTLHLLLVQAGMSMSVGALLLSMAVGGPLLMIVAGTVVDHGMVNLGAAIAGTAAPLVYVRRCRRSRYIEFARLFPSALDMMKAAMQAGCALNHALEAVCEEFPDPISAEFRQVLEELRLGLSPRVAFQNLQRRMNIADVHFFSMAVLIQRETGGNLSEVLDRVATTLRERFKLQAHIRAVTAQGRMSMFLVGGLPPGTALLLFAINPHYFDHFLAHPVAPTIITAVLLLQLAGFLWIRQITTLRDVQVT